MRGTVKFFDLNKGWGFLTRDSDGVDYFFHHSNIIMSGFRAFATGDIVDFEATMESGDAQRVQAINVTPILTREMVEKALKREKLYLRTMKDALGYRAFMVVDENNVIQAGEQGMSLVEVAAFAGIDVSGLE